MPVIREYFYLLKQAVLTGDPNLLFSRYHDLATGTDREKGINTEAQHITSMQSLAPFHGNIYPEYYESIKIKGSSTELEIMVHGMKLYLIKMQMDLMMNQVGSLKWCYMCVRRATRGRFTEQTRLPSLNEKIPNSEIRYRYNRSLNQRTDLISKPVLKIRYNRITLSSLLRQHLADEPDGLLIEGTIIFHHHDDIKNIILISGGSDVFCFCIQSFQIF
jgi:hypothetical protein